MTNSYRANGGGHFPDDALLQCVWTQPRLRVRTAPAWRLAQWPKTVVATLLASAADVPPPPFIAVAPLGPADDGFSTFRVTPGA